MTKYLNNLQDGLVKEDDIFLHDEINEKTNIEIVQKLDATYKQFLNLHERFLCFRIEDTDRNAERENLKREKDYVLKV